MAVQPGPVSLKKKVVEESARPPRRPNCLREEDRLQPRLKVTVTVMTIGTGTPFSMVG